MAHIKMAHAHTCTREEAREKVESIARDLAQRFEVKHRWEGDVLRFERAGAAGAIVVDDRNVEVEVRIGIALAPVRKRIEHAIAERLEALDAE